MRLSGGRFATVQLDACSDLIRVSRSITKRGVHLRAGEDGVLYERRDGIRLRRQILDPHDDLPHVGAPKQPRPSAGRAVTESDERMFVAAGALLGIATESIREGLTRSTRPQTKPLRKRIVKTHRNVYRHVCSVAQRPQTVRLIRENIFENIHPSEKLRHR
jgi:hypothetical protein